MTIDFKSAQVIASLTRALDSLTTKWETAEKERDEARAVLNRRTFASSELITKWETAQNERDEARAERDRLTSTLSALITKWIAAAETMERKMRDNTSLTESGQAALLHQAIGIRGCAEELRVALGQPPRGEWPTGETYP